MGWKEELKTNLEKLGATLTAMIKDFSTLTVETSTSDAGKPAVLRARTEVNLDGDTRITIPVDGAAIDTALLALHNEAVKSAIEARVKTIQSVVDAANALTRAI